MEKDQVWERACRVWDTESESVKRLSEIVDSEAFSRAVDMIVSCKAQKGRILTTGVGTSATAAKKIAHSFSCIEIPSFFLSPADGVHGGLGSVQPGDVVIAVSKGGNTLEVINIIPSIKAKSAKLIAVTENIESELAKNSDLVLRVKIEKEADDFNMLATASTMAVIAVFDAIAIVIMKYTNYTKEQFAIIHPGGAVGERLKKEKK